MYYPIYVELSGRTVLVVGGGTVAERKVQSLVEAGASVIVVSPEVTPRLQELAAGPALTIRLRKFQEDDIDAAFLVISATDDPETQKEVVAAARRRRVLVNTVDLPALCDFIVPAVVRRGEVVAALSTSGKSPALAAALRRRLEQSLPKNVDRVASLMGSVRAEVFDRFEDADRRKEAFERIIESGILDWIEECDDVAARHRVRAIIEESK